MDRQIVELAARDGRYSVEAFRFLYESLEVATRMSGKEDLEGGERHVTGQQVLAAMREHAQRSFGPLAAQVWRSWGIHASIDWGHVVFLLVEAQLLKRQDTDSIEDFRDDFDFDKVFVREYRPALPAVNEGPEPA